MNPAVLPSVPVHHYPTMCCNEEHLTMTPTAQERSDWPDETVRNSKHRKDTRNRSIRPFSETSFRRIWCNPLAASRPAEVIVGGCKYGCHAALHCHCGFFVVVNCHSQRSTNISTSPTCGGGGCDAQRVARDSHHPGCHGAAPALAEPRPPSHLAPIHHHHAVAPALAGPLLPPLLAPLHTRKTSAHGEGCADGNRTCTHRISQYDEGWLLEAAELPPPRPRCQIDFAAAEETKDVASVVVAW
jgi:hypothetical protein